MLSDDDFDERTPRHLTGSVNLYVCVCECAFKRAAIKKNNADFREDTDGQDHHTRG